MDTTNKEMAVIDVPTRDVVASTETQYDKLISMAMESGADIDRLEKLMLMKMQWEDNEARKEYFKALADFKKDPPLVKKDKTVRYQNSDNSWTEYDHADLGRSLNIISKALSPHGLSVNFKQEQGNGGLMITCILTHRLGYSESTSLFAAPDSSGGKNGIQGIGSADSYLRRYTLFAITGLAPEGCDDDGVMSEQKQIEYISEKQVSQIADMLLAIDKTIDGYCSYLKVESIEAIPLTMFNKCIADLQPPEVK